MLWLLEEHRIIVTTFDVDTEDIDAFSQFFEKDGISFFIKAYSTNKQSDKERLSIFLKNIRDDNFEWKYDSFNHSISHINSPKNK